jgi:hypothetical protein
MIRNYPSGLVSLKHQKYRHQNRQDRYHPTTGPKRDRHRHGKIDTIGLNCHLAHGVSLGLILSTETNRGRTLQTCDLDEVLIVPSTPNENGCGLRMAIRTTRTPLSSCSASRGWIVAVAASCTAHCTGRSADHPLTTRRVDHVTPESLRPPDSGAGENSAEWCPDRQSRESAHHRRSDHDRLRTNSASPAIHRGTGVGAENSDHHPDTRTHIRHPDTGSHCPESRETATDRSSVSSMAEQGSCVNRGWNSHAPPQSQVRSFDSDCDCSSPIPHKWAPRELARICPIDLSGVVQR